MVEGARGLRAAPTSGVVAAGWPPLHAPEASASPPCRPKVGGRSGQVEVCNRDGPTNLTTARPPTNGLDRPPSAHRRRRDDRSGGRRPAPRPQIDRRGLGTTRDRPIEEGRPAATLRPVEDRGPATRRRRKPVSELPQRRSADRRTAPYRRSPDDSKLFVLWIGRARVRRMSAPRKRYPRCLYLVPTSGTHGPVGHTSHRPNPPNPLHLRPF